MLAAGRTGRIVNIKKGQFVAPHDIRHAAEKVASTGNSKILLTERGSSFGYNNLVVDMRGLAIMRDFGWPVVFDATHSVQLPGAGGGASGGQPQFIETLARAAVAVGIDGLFVEVHDAPEKALSDGANALDLKKPPGTLAPGAGAGHPGKVGFPELGNDQTHTTLARRRLRGRPAIRGSAGDPQVSRLFTGACPISCETSRRRPTRSATPRWPS